MPNADVTREISGSTVSFVVAGLFDGACAWDLTARLSREPLKEVVLDFSRVDHFVDYAIATLAQSLISLTGKSWRLRGLRQHQERVFKCFGVDIANFPRTSDAISPSVLNRIRPLTQEVG